MSESWFGRRVALLALAGVMTSINVGGAGPAELPAELQRVVEAHEAAWRAEYGRILSILSELDDGPIWLQGAPVPERYRSKAEDLHLWALHHVIDGNVAYITVTYGYGERAASQDNGQFLLAVERAGPSEPWIIPEDLQSNAGPPSLPQPPFTMPKPAGWHAEEFGNLPPVFAADLPHDGVEALRFAPGMFEAGAEDFWSYAFVWWVRPESVFTAESLSAELGTYLTGLAALVSEARNVSIAGLSSNVALTESGIHRFEGVVETTDASVTLSRLTLNAEVEVLDCGDQGRKAAFFRLSPQPRGHEVWAALQSIREGFSCSSRNASSPSEPGALAAPQLDEEAVLAITDEMVEAARNGDLDALKKYLYTGTTIVLDLDPGSGSQVMEMDYDTYVGMLEMTVPMMEVREVDCEVLKIELDSASNRAVIEARTVTIAEVMGTTIEEENLTETTYGVIDGEIKVLSASGRVLRVEATEE